MMSNPYLPTELLDHIADLLHDTSDALKSCCLISKSWIPRTRKHLFADVKFRTPTNLSTWKNTFPDPSTSPACYTGSLFIKYPQPITPADAEEGGWITTFSRVVRFEVDIHQSTVDLVPFHAFSPAIKSLHITFLRLPPIQILDLAYSFPSLEDLSLSSPTWSYYGLNAELPATPPPNPPAFTGSLELFLWGGMSPIASQLLALPSGLHFRRLKLTLRRGGDISSTMELVERCSSTLETLEIDFKAARWPRGLINLSKATKLREVVFAYDFDAGWITTALQTITHNHRDFQQLSIVGPRTLDNPGFNHLDCATMKDAIGETAYLKWMETDHVLAQLHESHSIRPKVVFWENEQWMRGCMECLLPEVTKRGIVDLTFAGTGA